MMFFPYLVIDSYSLPVQTDQCPYTWGKEKNLSLTSLGKGHSPKQMLHFQKKKRKKENPFVCYVIKYDTPPLTVFIKYKT